MWRRLTLTASLLAAMTATGATEVQPEARHQAMLEAIRQSVIDSASYTGRSELSPGVMTAMATVRREEFVAAQYRHLAYHNKPLPIEANQTISQPLIVALMTDLLDPQAGDIILEVGTGSGYQAAVLAELVSKVYSVEIVPELAASATQRLHRLGYENISVRSGDGYAGWPEHAPFDGIIVTAAAPTIPPPLLEQLRPGGKLVIPVGETHGYQELLLLEMGEDGAISRRSVLPVRFVPLTGKGEEVR